MIVCDHAKRACRSTQTILVSRRATWPGQVSLRRNRYSFPKRGGRYNGMVRRAWVNRNSYCRRCFVRAFTRFLFSSWEELKNGNDSRLCEKHFDFHQSARRSSLVRWHGEQHSWRVKIFLDYSAYFIGLGYAGWSQRRRIELVAFDPFRVFSYNFTRAIYGKISWDNPPAQI